MNSLVVTVSAVPTPGSAGGARGPQDGARSGSGALFGEALESAAPAPAAEGGETAGAGARASGKEALPGGKTLPPEGGDPVKPDESGDDAAATTLLLAGSTSPVAPDRGSAKTVGTVGPGRVTPDATSMPGRVMPDATTSPAADPSGEAAGTTPGAVRSGETTAATPDGRGPALVGAAAGGSAGGLAAGGVRGPETASHQASTPFARSSTGFPPPERPQGGAPGQPLASAPGLAAGSPLQASLRPDPVVAAMSGAVPQPGESAPALSAAVPAAGEQRDAPRPGAVRDLPAPAEGARLSAAIEAARAAPAPAARERLLLESAQLAEESAGDAVQAAPGKAGTTAHAASPFSTYAAVDPLAPAAPRATPAAPATLSPAHAGFDLDLVGQVRVMLRDGKSEARLQLNPPELGRLDIRIATEGDQARVLFTVQGADARDAIEQALPRLREMLEQGGLQLSRFDVSDQSRQRHGEAREFLPGELAEPAAEEGSPRPSGLPVGAPATRGLVDYYV